MQIQNLTTMRMTLSLICLLLLSACTESSPRQFTQDAERQIPVWTAEELAKPIAVRPLGNTPETSRFAIRLNEAEKPHIHRDHDLIAVVLEGYATAHVGAQIFHMKPGDLVEIPRGVIHWVMPVDGPCVAYAVFSPTYDGSDNHPVE
jgi:mannose-6-phosphate isomerase-like protein (cupin superfamily)